MRNGGGLWEDRLTRDWFWIEKKREKYFSSNWISCIDAVRILKGQRPAPRTCLEVEDIDCFEPVSRGVIELLTKAVDRMQEAI